MFTIVHTTTTLSLDEHFIKRPAATFFVMVEGDGMVDHDIYEGDTLIINRSLTPAKNSIVIVVIDGELTVRHFQQSTVKRRPSGASHVVRSETCYDRYALVDCNNFYA
jgi:SOS-response transcriptional repressor LexA